jgi:hypothetical protein
MKKTLIFLTLALIAVSCLQATKKQDKEVNNTENNSIAVIESHKQVLLNEITISTTDKGKVYLKNYYDDDNPEIKFAVVDMDGDGIPEVVLKSAYSSIECALVLRYEDNVVYTVDLQYYGHCAISKKGLFSHKIGAGHWTVNRLRFHKGAYEEILLAEELEYRDEYFVNGIAVTEDEYIAFSYDEVDWYDYTIENVKRLEIVEK